MENVWRDQSPLISCFLVGKGKNDGLFLPIALTSKLLKDTLAVHAGGGGGKKQTRFDYGGIPERDHLELLKWATENGMEFGLRTSREAARVGHLEVLQWLRSFDPPCPWNERIWDYVDDDAIEEFLISSGAPR